MPVRPRGQQGRGFADAERRLVETPPGGLGGSGRDAAGQLVGRKNAQGNVQPGCRRAQGGLVRFFRHCAQGRHGAHFQLPGNENFRQRG